MNTSMFWPLCVGCAYWKATANGIQTWFDTVQMDLFFLCKREYSCNGGKCNGWMENGEKVIWLLVPLQLQSSTFPICMYWPFPRSQKEYAFFSKLSRKMLGWCISFPKKARVLFLLARKKMLRAKKFWFCQDPLACIWRGWAHQQQQPLLEKGWRRRISYFLLFQPK